MALSRQLDGEVATAVPVVEGSGVSVGRTRVGTDKACLVGGRVEVMKRGGRGVDVTVSEETFTHEVNVKMIRRKIQAFFMGRFYFEICLNRKRRELPLCSLRLARVEWRRSVSIQHTRPSTALSFCSHRPDSFGTTKVLRFGKDDHIISIVVEEGIAHADLSVGVAQKILVVIWVGLVSCPPVDNARSIQRGITAVHIFGHVC